MFDGELYASPRPALPHTRAASLLGAELIGSFDRGLNGPGGWVILHGSELHFGNDVLVPDIAGWRRSRLPNVPADAYLTLAPGLDLRGAFAINRDDRPHQEVAHYARVRVAHAWLLDPLRQTLEVLSLESARWAPVAIHEGRARYALYRSTRLSLSSVPSGSNPRASPPKRRALDSSHVGAPGRACLARGAPDAFRVGHRGRTG